MRRASFAVAMPFSVTKIGVCPPTSHVCRTAMPSAGGKYSHPVSVRSAFGSVGTGPSLPMKVRR